MKMAAATDDNTPTQLLAGYSPNAVRGLADDFLATGKPPAVGMGSKPEVQYKRDTIMNYAGEVASKLGLPFSQIQAAYAANKTAASQVIQRAARIDTNAQTLAVQFPRLAQLAAQIGQFGNITEQDLNAGKAAFENKFGGVAAGNYYELINSLRGEYASLIAATAGGKGGVGYLEPAEQAIPIGATPAQYMGKMQTILGTAKAAKDASWAEARERISNPYDLTGGNATAPQGGSGDGGQQALIQQAQDAISRGADPAKVKARLATMGVQMQ